MTELINQYDSEGRPHGVWENYHKDGTLYWKRHYLHGQRHKLYVSYYRTGIPHLKRYYLNIK